MADTLTGVAVTFDSGYLGNLTSITPRVSVAEIDTTTAATTGGKTFQPSDLYECELDAEILFAPATSPTIIGSNTAGNITLTWSDSGSSTWTGTAFYTSLEVQASDVDDRVRASCTLRWSGNITHG